MNKMNLEELSRVVPIIAINNVELTDEFDYFRIVSLEKNKYDRLAKNPLFFFSYSLESEVNDGWYPKEFDLRKKANDIIKNNPNMTFVIEEGMVDSIENKNAKFIVVPSISDAIDRLFEYTKNKYKPNVVGVTGSVGKTTTVGLIESVLKEKYKVLRIYSKRITPIILKANIINFLDDKIDYIVLEYSIYYHDHVKILSTLLPPTIACMLNISSSHMGVDTLNTLDDICVNKAEILRNANASIINIDDEYLRKLIFSNYGIEYRGDVLFESDLNYIDMVTPTDIEVVGDEIKINEILKVKPFILSKLAKTQYKIAGEVGLLCGLSKEETERGLNSYAPVENRLKSENAFGKDIIFDGDITTYERMKELSDLEYETSYLVIRKVGSNENTLRISNITDFFNKFKRVFIFDDIEYLDEFKNHENVTIVSNHDFMNDLDGKIIYHYSGYYRVWDSFDENNLNIYDREKYPIIKEKVSENKKRIR